MWKGGALSPPALSHLLLSSQVNPSLQVRSGSLLRLLLLLVLLRMILRLLLWLLLLLSPLVDLLAGWGRPLETRL